MSLESFNFIDSLNASNPTTTDNVSEGDDHIRGIKSTLKTTFPSINAAITATDEEINLLDGVTATTAELNTLDGITSTVAELNILDGVTSTAAELNILDGVTSTATEINLLDGVTATTAELNYVDGVTSNIQTQLGTKLPLAGGTMTGDVSLGDNVKAKFGASDDLQIYHSGTGSVINENGTGALSINTNGANIQFTKGFAENLATFNADGACNFYNNNALKLATTSNGVDVTGSVTCDGFTSTGIDDNATSTAITIDASENVGVGRTSPSHKLDVLGDVRISSVINDATNKTSRIKFGHYTNAEEPVTGMFCNSFATTSTLNIGGGSSIENAQTDINFRTAANNTTVGGTPRLSINSTGNVTVETGNLVIGTSGKGIDFSATSDGSGTMTSEVLDDYEEGTFTPTMTPNTSGTITLLSTHNLGAYTKVGNKVTVTGQIRADVVTSPVGNLEVSLPFAVAAGNQYFPAGSVSTLGIPFSGNYLSAYADPGFSYFRLLQTNTDTSWGFITANVILSGDRIQFGLTYMTTE